MKTIVHIGTKKTGTSALQNTLKNSRSHLKSRGVLYPENPPGCPFKNHRLIAASFTKYESLPRHMKNRNYLTKENLGQRYAEFLAHLDAQIGNEKPDCMVLSSESLFRNLPKKNREELRELYDRFGDTHFVAYLRKPSDYFLSVCQQVLKASSRISQPHSPSYKVFLTSYLDTFGQDSLTTRCFHRSALLNNDIVADFCGNFLGEYGVEPAALRSPANSNETMSAESMSILARYRFFFHRDKDELRTRGTRKLLHALRALELSHGAGRPKLHQGVADMIDYSTTDPLWVRDHLSVEFVGYDYARLERNGAEPLPNQLP